MNACPLLLESPEAFKGRQVTAPYRDPLAVASILISLLADRREVLTAWTLVRMSGADAEALDCAATIGFQSGEWGLFAREASARIEARLVKRAEFLAAEMTASEVMS